MPTNLYGPGDNFDLMQSHVVPALMVKAHDAKRARAPAIEVWGTGTPRREFLYVDDAADGMVFLMQNYSDEAIVNLGPGRDVPIVDLVELICKVVGYQGRRALRRQPARRHAAQDGRHRLRRVARLARADTAARGPDGDLPVVPRQYRARATARRRLRRRSPPTT